jgi:hypothetical protein
VRVKKSFEVFYGRLEFFNSELLECKLVEFRVDEGIFEILIEVLLLFSNMLLGPGQSEFLSSFPVMVL